MRCQFRFFQIKGNELRSSKFSFTAMKYTVFRIFFTTLRFRCFSLFVCVSMPRSSCQMMLPLERIDFHCFEVFTQAFVFLEKYTWMFIMLSSNRFPKFVARIRILLSRFTKPATFTGTVVRPGVVLFPFHHEI